MTASHRSYRLSRVRLPGETTVTRALTEVYLYLLRRWNVHAPFSLPIPYADRNFGRRTGDDESSWPDLFAQLKGTPEAD